MATLSLAAVKKSPIDWILFGAASALCALGLITMSSFQASDPFFERQLLWIAIGMAAFLVGSVVDWRFLRRTSVAAGFYGFMLIPLILLVVLGTAVKGAKSWIAIGTLGIEPAEFVNLALIILLAKYFSRRHIEIANYRHIIVSGIYAGLVFVLVAVQPDFGGAIIVALIWLGMVLFSGLSRKHLFTLLALGAVLFGLLWSFGFHDYQKNRILNFVNPARDIHGTGYNAYQSTVAVGSGQLLGKGIGYGSQSKLRFLPEYQTDFIFAAFAEEWGFVGIAIVLVLYGVIFWRLLWHAARGASNFEALFALGVMCYLAAHTVLHAGINLGVLPVTGTTIPFMSYGGSHLLAEFLALGMVCGMAAYSRVTHPANLERDWQGGYDR